MPALAMRRLLMAIIALTFTLFTATQAAAQSGGCSGCEGLEAEINKARATALAGTPQPANSKVIIYLFWGDGCPHCAEEKPFLEQLAQRYPTVEVESYEVWYVEENRPLLTQMAAARGFEPKAVPTTFIGEKYWEGFSEPIRREMESVVAQCVASGCPDAGQGIMPGSASESRAATPYSANACGPTTGGSSDSCTGLQSTAASASAANLLDIPLLGALDLSTHSLALSTVLIAFVDGFNPCSLWVLSMLLALTLHTGSRKKVFIIGLVFVTVTALVYALFIAGLFTMFSVVSFVGWIRLVVALVALFFAAVNIKDYFWYKEGISFTIADDQKPGLYRRMRRVLNAGDSLPALVGATVVMAAGASLVEFSCTAGFPMLWTNLLVAQGATALTFVALLGLYMLIYQIDELGIFLAAVVSMRASKLEEKHGRILKLIGGILMLTLAGVMLVDPALMNQISTSLLVFAVAFGASLVVLAVHRVILPRMGVHIGTETLSQPRPARSPKEPAGERQSDLSA